MHFFSVSDFRFLSIRALASSGALFEAVGAFASRSALFFFLLRLYIASSWSELPCVADFALVMDGILCFTILSCKIFRFL